MQSYTLSKTALRDVAAIVSYLHGQVQPSLANEVEERLFSSFRELGAGTALGHKRTDLTTRKVLFHTVRPYVIIFRRAAEGVHILRVTHGSRDIRRLI